jgi:ankyrin repeat protein
LLRIAKEDEHALHMKDRNGWQPIHEAVRHGDKHVIEFLKEQGADLNSQTMRGGPTVLDIALDSEDTGYIRWIKSLGATMSRYELGPDL